MSGTVKEFIQKNQQKLKVYLGIFVNDLLHQDLCCDDCKQKILAHWKEVMKNPETLYR